MKAKQLKDLLSYIDDNEDIYLDIGGNISELASLTYNNNKVYLCSHSYAMDDNMITITNMCKYLKDK